MEKAMKKILTPIYAFLMIIGLQACSDNDEILPDTSAPPPPVTTVVDAAVSAGNFTTLVAALQATGLDATLADPTGTYTVFAPTDDAFALLGQDTIDSLLADTDTLASILTYHVLGTEVDAAGAIAAAGTRVTTLNGKDIAISVSGSTVYINGSTVAATDITTDNGIIHVIDAVLIPPADAGTPTANIVDTAVAAGDFTTLVAALQATGLDAVLADESAEFTVFAPTDAAFEMVGEETINTLLANPDVLSDILLQHVVAGSVDSITAYSLNGVNAITASGAEIAIGLNTTDDLPTFGGANVVMTDIYTTNGIIHVIDMVIVGDVEIPEPAQSIVDVAVEAGSFTTLVAALQATGLDTVLADPTAEFTVFAPTDAAFALLPEGTVEALLADTDTLSNILLYHVISGATILQDAAVTVAQSGENTVGMANMQDAALSLGGSTLYINQSAVSAANVMADNGVIHVVDQVILPPAMRGEPTETIVDIAVGNPDFSTLVTALSAAGLVDTLADETATFTVFAPTDAAFAKIEGGALAALVADVPALTDILLSHVIAGAEVNSVAAYAANGAEVTTASGGDATVALTNFTQVVDDAMTAVAYDAMNQRLIGGGGSAQPGFTLYTFDGDLTTGGSVCNDGCATNWPPVTVADAMSATGVPGLGTIIRDDASIQVTYLGRPLYYFAGDSAAGEANGQGAGDVWYQVDQEQVALQVEGSNVIVKDIYATNGVIHVIDTVITSVMVPEPNPAADLIGTWRITPQEGSLGVGPTQGDISWWNIPAEGVTIRACFFDDDYIFNEDGTFQNVLGADTWLEAWQSTPGEECGAPVAPHDGSGSYTWTYDNMASTITIDGTGGYLGIPKAVNAGEIGNNVAEAPASVTYLVTALSATQMTIDIEAGAGVWWRFEMTKQ